MTPVDLAQCGRALYGGRWRSALARAIGVSDRTVRRWVQSKVGVPCEQAERIWTAAVAHQCNRILDEVEFLELYCGVRIDRVTVAPPDSALSRRVQPAVIKRLREHGITVAIERGAPAS